MFYSSRPEITDDEDDLDITLGSYPPFPKRLRTDPGPVPYPFGVGVPSAAANFQFFSQYQTAQPPPPLEMSSKNKPGQGPPPPSNSTRYCTRGSGLRPELEGVERQPWEFYFKPSKSKSSLVNSLKGQGPGAYRNQANIAAGIEYRIKARIIKLPPSGLSLHFASHSPAPTSISFYLLKWCRLL